MGAATVVENSLKATTTSFWNAVPTLPSLNINLDLSKYNQSFVNFAILFGIAAIGKSAISLAGSALKGKPKAPSRKQLLDKYGHLAWALVADCQYNHEYVSFLALNGFNLVLLGNQEHTRQCQEQAIRIDPSLKVEVINVDWAKEEANLQFYEGLVKQLQQYDIAFLVLPKLHKERGVIPTHLDQGQPFQHIYILVRYLGLKLKFRSYRSAIIFPSYPDVDTIQPYNGVTQGLINGSDAFGRIIGFELKGTVQVVVARGSVENAFAGLGVQRITQ